MPHQIKKLAILFADISGSTALYAKHGDGAARQMVAACINIMAGSIKAYQGRLIKTIGDEVMCAFPTAEAALHAACAMQAAVENIKSTENDPSSPPMHIRIGFNYGDVICEDDDVYGDTVNVAARITAITRARQISATQAVIDALPDALSKKTRKIQRTEIKGKQEQLDIFQVVWEADDMTRTRIGEATLRMPTKPGGQLTLTYQEQSVKINEQQKLCLLGRENTCHIIVRGNFASREHARVEFRFGKFIFTDQSMNGTFIQHDDNRVIGIMREATVLQASGMISLGLSFSENPTELIHFSVAFI